MNLLLVEDDIDLQKVLAQYLELSGFRVFPANHGKHGLEVFRKNHVDLCILDVMMPVMDGLLLGKEIRKLDPSMPIVFVTAKNRKEDRIKGLQQGADDYITKPFEAEELVLRIRNILKRSTRSISETVKLGNLEIRFEELLIREGDQDHHLTQKEAELLKYLLENKNTLLKREQILMDLWGENDYFLGRSMDVFISRLRKYLSSEETISLETIRGVGFICKTKSHTP